MGSDVMVALLTLQVTLIGPIMPFLRAEMGLSYSEGALHTSVFAIGMMAAGLYAALPRGNSGVRPLSVYRRWVWQWAFRS